MTDHHVVIGGGWLGRGWAIEDEDINSSSLYCFAMEPIKYFVRFYIVNIIYGHNFSNSNETPLRKGMDQEYSNFSIFS